MKPGSPPRRTPWLGEHLGERAPAEARVQGQPSVDAPRHGHRANVVAERDVSVPVGEDGVRVGTGAGATDREQRLRTSATTPRMDYRDQVAAESAQVLGRHGEHRAGCHRGVGSGPAGAQQRNTGGASELVDGADDSVRRGHRGVELHPAILPSSLGGDETDRHAEAEQHDRVAQHVG